MLYTLYKPHMHTFIQNHKEHNVKTTPIYTHHDNITIDHSTHTRNTNTYSRQLRNNVTT